MLGKFVSVDSEKLNSLYVFLAKVIGAAVSYLVFVSFSRFMDDSSFASFNSTFSSAMLLTMAAAFGLQIFTVKTVSESRVVNVSTLNHDVFSEGSVYVFVLVCFTVCSFIILSTLTAIGFSKGDFTTFFGVAVFVVLFAFTQVTTGVLRVNNGLNAAVFTRDLLWRLLTLALVIVCGVSTQVSVNTNTALALMSVALVPVAILHLHFIFCRIDKSVDFRLPKLRFWKLWTVNSFGLCIVAWVSGADVYVFTIVATKLLEPIEAGVFFASIKTVELINLLLTAVTLTMTPKIAKAISLSDNELLQAHLVRLNKILLVPVIVTVVFLALLGDVILSLFNEAYGSYTYCLYIMILAMFLNTITGPTVLMLQLNGLHWFHCIAQGVSLLLGVLFAFVVGFNFDLVGIAFSYLISKILWNLSAVIMIRVRMRVDPTVLSVVGRSKKTM